MFTDGSSILLEFKFEFVLPPPDPIKYHLQIAVEKYLDGFLLILDIKGQLYILTFIYPYISISPQTPTHAFYLKNSF